MKKKNNKIAIGIAATLLFFVLVKHQHDLLLLQNSSAGSSNLSAALVGDISKQVLQKAIDLESHLKGSWMNSYIETDLTGDPALPGVMNIFQNAWAFASPGNLQCAMYVQTVFQLAGHPVPLGNGVDYWNNATTNAGLLQQGWIKVPNGQGMPAPGDLAVWDYGNFGHVAIVGYVQPPKNGVDGFVLMLEANNPPNVSVQFNGTTPTSIVPLAQEDPAHPGVHLYKMTISAKDNKVVSDWGTFLGFRHNPAYNMPADAPNPGMPAGVTDSPYILTAVNAARDNNINELYFIRQIARESGFNPNAISPAGAIGIAQFMPATAQSHGVNPNDPISSLAGAAKMDADNLKAYGGQPGIFNKDAYFRMLAAYNAGSVPPTLSLAQIDSSKLPAETVGYVKYIMGV